MVSTFSLWLMFKDKATGEYYIGMRTNTPPGSVHTLLCSLRVTHAALRTQFFQVRVLLEKESCLRCVRLWAMPIAGATALPQRVFYTARNQLRA